VAGNLVTASPANDTITPLMALGATLTLQSVKGKRCVPLSEFYLGVRRSVLRPDEMVVDITFPVLSEQQHGTFSKYALRKAQAISLLNAAVIVTRDDGIVREARIALGAVSPVIMRAGAAEAALVGKRLEDETIREAARLAADAARPISDVRSSAAYRKRMVEVVVRRALTALAKGEEKAGMPSDPVLLWGKVPRKAPTLAAPAQHDSQQPIVTTINGKEYSLAHAHHKTLLRMLREDAGLVGSKEGCAEGECGACTVFLDGLAVMSCMVPATRAHGAEIVTVEGLAIDGELHPVQQAFIDAGAVQCGYCTPGFLMSAAKLLEERPNPSQDEIKAALTGNLCRCTGYYKIIEAVEKAAAKGATSWA
jgi:carbon-monoxide dehydrogenase medium subunit